MNGLFWFTVLCVVSWGSSAPRNDRHQSIGRNNPQVLPSRPSQVNSHTLIKPKDPTGAQPKHPHNPGLVKPSDPRKPSDSKKPDVPKNATATDYISTPTHIIDVPTNCQPGQLIDMNGNCRDNWSKRKRSLKPDSAEMEDLKAVPQCIIGCEIPNLSCPQGQKPDASGNCRDDWDG